jgi:hypothetical protein
LDHEGGKLVRENFTVSQNFKKLVKKKVEACTMDGKKALETF